MAINDLINEIGGVTMKTIEDIKPVIDKAVQNASEFKNEVAASKDSVIKNEPGMENNISVQDIPTETKETPAAALITEFDKSGEYDQKDIEDTEDIGPDY